MKDDTKEIVSYVFVGGMTTLVNYVVYFILLKIHSHWLIANSMSWIFAVLFAYYPSGPCWPRRSACLRDRRGAKW